jgi:predicted ribosomally synthesized peptide with SipW-like signal peptide
MKSRMLISMLVIALAAAVIGGATMAWFTDEDTAGPVTFTAGRC